MLLSPIFMDGGGRPRVPREVAADIVKVSSAPVYAPIETFLGVGIVGGYMDTFESAGIAAADLVVEILLAGIPRLFLHRLARPTAIASMPDSCSDGGSPRDTFLPVPLSSSRNRRCGSNIAISSLRPSASLLC